LFDLAGARETVSTARDLNTPYAVVINAAPVKREDKEVPVVALSRAQVERLSVPVWSDRISQRAASLDSLAGGASAGESNSGGRLQVGDCPAVVGDRPLGRTQSTAPRWTPCKAA
jgi:hypothetical protein